MTAGGAIATGDRIATVRAARAAIARGWLAASGGRVDRGAAERVGEIVLEPQQAVSAGRVRRVLAEGGGALLADAVGTGKTYVALAVAAGFERVIVVGPAVLAPMWRAAMARCGVRARWVSFEGLSRGVVVGGPSADLVVVDEGHHARTPGTRRFAALAALCARARVLALSATPVHNGAADVRALVSLWRGAAAFEASDEEVASSIVRGWAGASPSGGRVPIVADPVWVRVGDDGAVLEALLAMAPPLPPSDGGGAEGLVMLGLVRQWASSEGALRAAIGRRLGQCVALESALEAGRHPDRRELRSWAYAEGAVQLAFPELASSVEAAVGSGLAGLLAAVRAHASGLRTVRRVLDSRPSVDEARAERLMEVVRRHAGERVVAFAQYGATVEALYRRVVGRARAAVLSGRGGRVAGGEVSRGELLRRFAPRSNGASEVGEAERVELLVTTDLLSEGVNLQDASVVVHLDLPWTPARLAQRVGRAARMGSVADRVSVYAFEPPASAERWVGVERRLRAKAAAAAQSVGAIGVILPGIGVGGPASGVAASGVDVSGVDVNSGPASDVERMVEVGRVIGGWLEGGGSERAGGEGPIVAVARGEGQGFLALVRRGGRLELIASGGRGASAASAAVLAAVRAADSATEAGEAVGEEVVERLAAMRAEVELWAAGERVALDVGLRSASMAAVRRRVLERIARAVRRAPRHARGEIIAMAAEARRAAVAAYGMGAERVLAELEGAAMGDAAWLRAVGAFGGLHSRGDRGARSGGGAVRVVAAIVFSG